MRSLASRLLRPFLPVRLRRVEALAQALGSARDRTEEAPALESGPLDDAIASRVEAVRQARERARKAREAADAAEEYQREFLLAMSHEIRTPLNAIQGFSRVLLDEIDGPLGDEERVDVRAIHEAGNHLADLLRDFLAVVSERSSRPPSREAPFSGRGLLEEVVRVARGLEREGNVPLRIEEAQGDVVFFADRGSIQRVLMNLVSNALKFTTEGEVVLSVRPGGEGRGVLSVKDTGSGMAPRLDSARAEFEQAPDEARLGRGTGLGLSLVERMVRLSNGELRIHSRPGRGTTVEVELPRTTEAP